MKPNRTTTHPRRPWLDRLILALALVTLYSSLLGSVHAVVHGSHGRLPAYAGQTADISPASTDGWVHRIFGHDENGDECLIFGALAQGPGLLAAPWLPPATPQTADIFLPPIHAVFRRYRHVAFIARAPPVFH